MNGVVHNGRSCNQGFTLIELLVVVAIMATLMAITIPAFESMGRGTAVRTAATQVASAITFARQQAVVSGVNTYLMFPNGDSALYSGLGSEHREKAFRSYAVYSEKDGYIRPWMFLPKGTVFVPSQASFPDNPSGVSVVRDTKSIFTTDVNLKKKVSADLYFPGNSPTGMLKNVRVLGFSPDGRLFDPDGSLGAMEVELYIAEGVIDPTLPGSIVPLFRNPEASDLYMVNMIPLTGQGRIVDLRGLE